MPTLRTDAGVAADVAAGDLSGGPRSSSSSARDQAQAGGLAAARGAEEGHSSRAGIARFDPVRPRAASPKRLTNADEFDGDILVR